MDQDKLPKHLAIIMDGNGRWAKARGLLRTQGHLEGVKRVEEIIASCRRLGIGYLTIYAFSTENWTRPADEVSMLMNTFVTVLAQKAKELHANGIKINFIGRRVGVPDQVLRAIDGAMQLTAANSDMTLNVAFNYGARAEIVDAFKQIAAKVAQGQLAFESIDEQMVSASLYTKGQPDPDLLIRTSGEERISNFLLWQLSYAELYFTEKCWPDFNEEQLRIALAEYAKRERRYGRV